jgi:hypothetical protein
MSPSRETASCAATQEFPKIVWNPNAYQLIQGSPPLIPILGQINPIHTTPSYIFKINFNIIHPLTSWTPY